MVHHLKNNITDPNNLVLIVGFQAENTLGRKLVDGETAVRIHGEIFPVKAEVAVVDAFSGHADRSDLMTFVSNIKGLKKTFIVHGEETQANTFAEILGDTHPGTYLRSLVERALNFLQKSFLKTWFYFEYEKHLTFECGCLK